MNNNSILDYRVMNHKESIDTLNYISNYIKNNNSNNTFIIDTDAYIYKLNAQIRINKYDLLNNGNLGKNGDDRIIKDFENICSKEKCTFLVYEGEEEEGLQLNKKIRIYIMNKYSKVGKIVTDIGVYQN